MTAQLFLPGFPRNYDPEAELERIEPAKLNLRADIRDVLDRYADAHDVSAQAVTDLMHDYVADLVSDFFFEREDEQRAEIEADIRREDDPWGLRAKRYPA